MVLLAAAAACVPRRRLRAVHVDHGWHSRTDGWAQDCRRRAAALGVNCEVVRVDAVARAGEGPEAAARKARYAALQARLEPGAVLLTAHHADDQAETVLLGLLRGGGLRAWAGMPAERRLPPGRHLRPFLRLSRAALEAERERRRLPAIADPSNRDTDYDRAFLRERVLPALRERWPAVDAGLCRSADLAADAIAVEDGIAAEDHAGVRSAATDTLDCARLLALPAARQRTLVRGWLRRRGLQAPPARRLESALAQIATARPDRNPRIVWSGGELRRWDGRVWALARRPDPRPGEAFDWHDRERPLVLPDRRLLPADLDALGIDRGRARRVRLLRRRGGERVVLPDACERALSYVLRQAGLPPWDRDAAVLVEVDGRIAGVLAPGLRQPLAAAPARPDRGDRSARP